MTVTLSPGVRKLFEETNFAHIATVMRDGSPQVSPVWVDLRGDLILVNTAEGRVKPRNVRRDPRVALSIFSQQNPYAHAVIPLGGFLLHSAGLVRDGRAWLFFLLLVIVTGDTAGYFVGHRWGKTKLYPEVSPGKTVEGAVASNEGGWTSFPDRTTEILDIFGEGDRVVAHIRMMGTNMGGIDWAGVPPSDNKVDIDWIQVSRHADDGTIVETWAQMDIPKMMMQLGAMPAPGGM